MALESYQDLAKHYGHTVAIAMYGVCTDTMSQGAENVALECLDCSEVLLDFDEPMVENKDPMTMNNEEFQEFIKGMNEDYADAWILMRFEAIVSRLRKKKFILKELL